MQIRIRTNVSLVTSSSTVTNAVTAIEIAGRNITFRITVAVTRITGRATWIAALGHDRARTVSSIKIITVKEVALKVTVLIICSNESKTANKRPPGRQKKKKIYTKN